MVTYSRHLLYQILHQTPFGEWHVLTTNLFDRPSAVNLLSSVQADDVLEATCRTNEVQEEFFSSALCIDARLSRVESLAALLSFETYYLPPKCFESPVRYSRQVIQPRFNERY